MPRETHLYEILIRCGPAGYLASHAIDMERITDGAELLAERALDPRPITTGDLAGLIDAQLPALAAQLDAAAVAAAEKDRELDTAVSRAVLAEQNVASLTEQLVGAEQRIAVLNEELAAALAPTPALGVSRRQMKLALLEAGLLDEIEAFVAQAPREIRIGWEEAAVFLRDDPMLVAGAEQLGKTSDEIDAIFAAAAAIL